MLTNCEYQILSKNISSSYSIQSHESTITYDFVLQLKKEVRLSQLQLLSKQN